MELITSIRKAIDYMETHLTDNISAQDVADQVYLFAILPSERVFADNRLWSRRIYPKSETA